jgi:MoxR-like ATPase
MPPKPQKIVPTLSLEGYSYDQLRPLVQATLDAGISVLVLGHPGIGKSTLAIELAKTMARPLIDIRLAQRDPAEIGGVYFPNRDKQVIELLAPDWVKKACAEPCFVFLDEINAAVTKLHQAAAYQIVLEKRVGPFTFHPGTVVMAAGNLEEDRAIVTPLSSALCNRFAHYLMRPDVASWLRWAAAAGINEQIMAYIKTYGEEVLYKAGNDYAFPTPRSWDMASRVMEKAAPADHKRVVAACVGAPMADQFFKYLDIYRKVDAAKIIQNGAALDFTKNSEPSFIYAAVFAVAGYSVTAPLADKHLENIVKFLNSPGLDAEYQILFLRHLRSRAKDLLARLKPLPEFRKLATNLVNLQASLYQ